MLVYTSRSDTIFGPRDSSEVSYSMYDTQDSAEFRAELSVSGRIRHLKKRELLSVTDLYIPRS